MSDGKEVRLNPEVLTFKEMQYNETDKRWYARINEIRSECGAFYSAGTATSSDLSSQLTDTRKMGGILTGVGTLSSAGMKFLLKEVVISATKKAAVSFMDSTTKKLFVSVASGGNTTLTDLKGCLFSTDCRIVATTGDIGIHVGGYRLALSV